MITKTIPFFDPHKIALSGQAFRFVILDDTHVELVAKNRYLQIACLGNDDYAFSCSEAEFEDLWKDYFDLDRDYVKIYESIDPRDTYLKDAADFGYGIRILHQEPFETLISYIISQRRSIPAITTSVERISETYGRKIKVPSLKAPFIKPSRDTYYAFPTCEALSKADLSAISDMGVGYRDRYIVEAVHDINSGKIDLPSLSKKSDNELYEVLTSMFGVGTKVANCTMLFGFGRTGRFPVDVWIKRILDKYYGGSFDTSPYPETAGIMQQFMFYYERNGAPRS